VRKTEAPGRRLEVEEVEGEEEEVVERTEEEEVEEEEKGWRKLPKSMEAEAGELLLYSLGPAPAPPASTSAAARLSGLHPAARDPISSAFLVFARLAAARGRRGVLEETPPPPKRKTREGEDVLEEDE
jgi:hypothetical protein